MTTKLWKSFKKGFENDHGNIEWKVGEWLHQDGDIKCCKNGFHASILPFDAMSFVNCEIIARVSVKGEHDEEDDKQAWSDMKIDKAFYWRKEDSVALSIFAAELCISNFEKLYPDDKRPREAIKAAKAWLENPTEENKKKVATACTAAQYAAETAARSAQYAAESAARSAQSAAETAARSAQSAAETAARSAQYAAESAARAVETAAETAARSAQSAAWYAALTKINRWLEERFKTLEEIKDV